MLGVLGLVSLIGLVIIVVWFSDNPLALEIAKSLLQIIVVVVLGTLVTLLIADYNHRQSRQEQKRQKVHRDEEKQREDALKRAETLRDESRRRATNLDEFRKKVLERLNRTYVDAKRARRLLRATAFSPPYYGRLDERATVLPDPYDQHLRTINDTQLDLEVLRRDVEANSLAFTHHRQLSTALEAMDDCLGKLITEYEKKRGDFNGVSPIMVSHLNRLQDFVKSRKSSTTFGTFVDQYKDATQTIQEDILAYARAPADTKDS
jgi:hypothetical protein